MTQEEFQEDVANSTATLLRKDQLEAATTVSLLGSNQTLNRFYSKLDEITSLLNKLYNSYV